MHITDFFALSASFINRWVHLDTVPRQMFGEIQKTQFSGSKMEFHVHLQNQEQFETQSDRIILPHPRPFSPYRLTNFHRFQSARLMRVRGGLPPSSFALFQAPRQVHSLPPHTSSVCSCLFRSLGMHLLRLCQGEPLCATCAALHRSVTLGTVLELKVLACAIICY